jgi:hypothetical protein
LVGRTSSSNGRPSARGKGRASVLFGLLGVASLPVAYALQQTSIAVSLLWAALGAVPAGIFGLVALALARRVRARARLTLGGIAGEGTARVGRLLGAVAVYAAVTVGLAVAFYVLLEAFGT